MQLSRPTFWRIQVRKWWLRDGKNCAMLNTKVLVERFLTQPKQMICIRATPVLVVDLNFNSPSWLGWMKSFTATWNWSFSPMTFLISLPNILRSIIGWKDLGWSYDCLLGLGITIVDNFLKWLGQYPRLIQAFVMLTMLLRYLSCLRMVLRWFYNNLSGPGVEELLQLLIACLNSSLKKGFQNIFSL